MKTILLALLLTCVSARAQDPPPATNAGPTNVNPPAAASSASASREQSLRQALRQATSGDANTAAGTPGATTATNPAPAAIPPGAAPSPGTPAVPAVPAPTGAAPAGPTASGTAAPNTPGAPPAAAAAPSSPGAPLPGAAPAGPAAPGAAPGPGAPPAGAAPPGPGTIAITPPPAAAQAPPEPTYAAGDINFRGVDLNQVLEVYAELVNRTVLRPATLNAQQIVLKTQTPLTKSEAKQALDAVLGMNGIAMIPVGDKFVKAVQTQTANQEGAAFEQRKAAQLPDIGQYMTHVIQLKFAKPSEMVAVLQPFTKIPNSILPIDSSMILVLRDFTENVKRMLEMIERIDVAVPAEYISEVIPIKYALASDIANALNSLSTGGGGATVGKATTTGPRTGFGGASGGAGGYRAGGMPGQMTTPGSIGGAGATTPGGTGSSFTDRLQNIIKRASVSGEIQVLGQTKIIADERTNALLIFAAREDMKMIKDIVAKLDVVLAQVLIEAVILSVDLGPNSRDFGISYLQHPKSSGDVTGVGAIGSPFYSPADFLRIGGTNGSGGSALAGGFNYLATFGQDLDVTVTAIARESRAKVLQRPRIQTSHAVQATIFVGQSRPYPTASYYGGGAYGGYASIQQLQIGVTLDVTPLINPDGLVVMDIHQTIEDYAGSVPITGVGDVPITTRKEAAAKVAVRDRDTIILGGLIENRNAKNSSGVPVLMDIPILGQLFRSTHSDDNHNELVVLIRPTVLPTPEIAALTAKAEKDKMPGVRRAEAEFQEEEALQHKRASQQERRVLQQSTESP